MKLIRYVEGKTETVEALCNKCGESCMKSYADEFGDEYGLVGACVSGGYLSDDLSDGMTYCFSLCEKCLKGLFATFKLPVQTHDYFEEPDRRYESVVTPEDVERTKAKRLADYWAKAEARIAEVDASQKDEAEWLAADSVRDTARMAAVEERHKQSGCADKECMLCSALICPLRRASHSFDANCECREKA